MAYLQNKSYNNYASIRGQILNTSSSPMSQESMVQTGVAPKDVFT